MKTKAEKNDCYGKLTMKCIPKDVHEFLIDKQVEFRKKQGTVVSMETTVIRLIKSHQEFKK